LNEKNSSFVLSIASELWNWELYFSVIEKLNKNLKASDFIAEFPDLELIDPGSEQVVDFLASHFFEFDSSALREVPISTLSAILSHPSLQLENEDALYDLIRSHSDSTAALSELLGFVRIDFLTEQSLEDLKWT
jgi:hypothetical protein